MGLVLYSSMVASVDVTLLLEDIDASTPAFVRALTRPYALLCCSLPILLLVWLTSYPLASANTTCSQVLVVHGLLCHSLDHLSASPHHILGCGDLDLLSGSPRSPPRDPPPLRLPSPKWHWWALVGA